MIRHVVFFTALAPEHRDTVRAGLELLKDIPDCLHWELGENQSQDPIPGPSPDFIVYAEFDDEAQLSRYKAHPLYQRAIEIVRPLRDMRIAADFTAG